MKLPIAGLLPEELVTQLSLDPAYRGEQLFKWIQKGIADFAVMTNIPAAIKEELSVLALLRSSVVDDTSSDDDGTIKIRVKLIDGQPVESVLLHDTAERKTACLSSQAGCGMGCAFCKTATMGLRRNLEAYEIVEQYLHLVERYGEIGNIVFMGMGEPLSNLENVRKAVADLHHPSGCNIGHRKFTISTCGIVSGIRELAKNGPYTRLALSLPSGDEDLRRKLMPAARNNPLEALKNALLAYGEKSKQRITIEVVLLREVNDTKENALSLAAFIRGLDADVNLIPWNPAPGLPYKRPEPPRIKWFSEALERNGVHIIQRYQKGNRIGAACGQLAAE
jgi:23S rRNA (adenine2503-C2)-methyltransferase